MGGFGGAGTCGAAGGAFCRAGTGIVVAGEEYDITRIIYEVFPSEATDMFNKYKEAYAGRQIIPLNKLP